MSRISLFVRKDESWHRVSQRSNKEKSVSSPFLAVLCSRPTRTCSRRKDQIYVQNSRTIPSPRFSSRGWRRCKRRSLPGHWNKLTLTIGGWICMRAYTGRGNRRDTLARKRDSVQHQRTNKPKPTMLRNFYASLEEKENLFFGPWIPDRNIYFIFLSKLFTFFS